MNSVQLLSTIMRCLNKLRNKMIIVTKVRYWPNGLAPFVRVIEMPTRAGSPMTPNALV